jgi:Predicted amidohydrolase
MKKRNPVVAVAQIRYFDIHKRNNVEKIKKYIRLAKKKHADIVCFPESCVHRTKTLHSDDEFIKQIKEECKENKIWAIITEDFILRGKRYNMAILINRAGKIAGNYKKIHLFGDAGGVNPGKKTRVFQTDFGKIGISICWDLGFSEVFHRMKKAGAQIVFCPAEWGWENKAYKKNHKKEELGMLRALVRTRAFEDSFFIVLGNPVEAKQEEVISYSAIVSPNRILKEIFDKEGLIVSKIDLKEIEKHHKIYSI